SPCRTPASARPPRATKPSEPQARLEAKVGGPYGPPTFFAPRETPHCMSDKPLSFQSLFLKLNDYWSRQGCTIVQAYDVEVGAGTLSPMTVLRALGPKPWKVVYVQPSRRPADGRYGENPNRLHQHHQYQVILKPNPPNLQELYLGSLEAIG